MKWKLNKVERLVITHVITTIERGGAEHALLTLAKYQVTQGHDVTVVPLKGRRELMNEFLEVGVKVKVDGLNRNIVRQVQFLRNELSPNTITHAHLPRAEIVCRLASQKGFRLATRHNAESFYPNGPSFISRTLSRWVTKKSHVIAISHAVLRFLKDTEELHQSCQAEVIHYGYERRLASPRSISQKQITGPHTFQIGTVSRLARQKNLFLLLQLTKTLVENGFDVHASILGDGIMKDSLNTYVFKNNLVKHVTFLGRSSKVLEFIQSLDIFFLCSNYEGFGLVLLEAMDAGVPIIAAKNSAIPEVLGFEHPGLFETNSLSSLTNVTINLLLSHPLRTQFLRIQNRRLKQFGVQIYGKSHDLTYNSLRAKRT